MGYDPKLDGTKQVAFLASASYLEVPKSPISSFRFDVNRNRNRAKAAMSFVSAEPLKCYQYQNKLLLRDIDDYMLMDNNTIALLTLPQADEKSEDAYPRLLVLLHSVMNNTNESHDNSLDKNKGIYIYEIPSSLHMIDLKQTQFQV